MRGIIPVIREHIIMSRDEQVSTDSYTKISSFTSVHISNDSPRCSLVITAVDWQYSDMRLPLAYLLYQPLRNRRISTVIHTHTIEDNAVAEVVVIPMLIYLIACMGCRNRSNGKVANRKGYIIAGRDESPRFNGYVLKQGEMRR